MYESGDAAAAGIPHLEAAVRRLPSRSDLALDLATLYEQSGQEAKADALLQDALGPEARRVLQEKKKQRDFYRALARLDELRARQKGEEALALLEQLVRESPPDMRDGLQKELLALRIAVEDIRRSIGTTKRATRWARGSTAKPCRL